MSVSETRAEAIVAGHICLDIIPRLGEHQTDLSSVLVPGVLNIVDAATVTTGGAVSNTGMALHRLGIATRLMGKLGDDPLGQAVLSVVRAEGAALADGMIIAAGETTSHTIVIDPPGVDRCFLHCPGANDTFSASDVDFSACAGARLFHFGYPTLMRRMYEDGGVDLAALFRRAKEQGMTTSLDMTFVDPSSEAAKVNWPDLLDRALPYVDVFLPSIEELVFMLDGTVIDEPSEIDGALLTRLSDRLLDMGTTVVVLKLGPQGMYMRTSNEPAQLDAMGACAPSGEAACQWLNRELMAPCYDVEVRGTTGAGDCAIAGFLAGLLHGQSPEQTLTSAVAAGAYNVESPGGFAGIPDWSEVQKRIKSDWRRASVGLTLDGWGEDQGTGLWCS